MVQPLCQASDPALLVGSGFTFLFFFFLTKTQSLYNSSGQFPSQKGRKPSSDYIDWFILARQKSLNSSFRCIMQEGKGKEKSARSSACPQQHKTVSWECQRFNNESLFHIAKGTKYGKRKMHQRVLMSTNVCGVVCLQQHKYHQLRGRRRNGGGWY